MHRTFFQPGKASVIVGGQFGSEAKGLVAANLLATRPPAPGVHLICTTNAGAQAGHTTVMADGRKFVCYHLPTIGVLHEDAQIYLNAGCIIDLPLLLKEIEDVCHVTGESVPHMMGRITVNPNAAVIYDDHKVDEKSGPTSLIGSTQKGVGAATVSKIRRTAGSVLGYREDLPFQVDAIALSDVLTDYAASTAVSIEVPQGTSLSINAGGFFPYCTSRECWIGQGMTDAGLHPSFLGKVAMVCRTYPIRVGNIYGPNGEITGPSGPFYPDSNEISWDDLPGVEPERTTVTKRVRRIAEWSQAQYARGLRLNRPDIVYLTFTNYLYHASGRSLITHSRRMDEVEDAVGVKPEIVYSWGPRVDQCSSELVFAMAESRRSAADQMTKLEIAAAAAD